MYLSRGPPNCPCVQAANDEKNGLFSTRRLGDAEYCPVYRYITLRLVRTRRRVLSQLCVCARSACLLTMVALLNAFHVWL